MSLDEAIGQLEKLVTEIRRVSLSDDKTSLSNSLALAQEERQINMGVSPFRVIIFGDLNDFKQLNDSYGYEAGDVGIRRTGETIQSLLVEGLEAKAFRQSGDEFVILLQEDMVGRFLAAAPSFKNISFKYEEQELRTAMSFGYARSDNKTSFRELLGRAEIACKHAKSQGDGACVEWVEDIESNPLVRRSGVCKKCNAKISCSLPQDSAPTELKLCPCCGDSLLDE
ncbi:MAG TPA: GGDEF domain-containing protein [Pyrinomonadaceae bacterium]|jgi:diguanylate cyclase (GGDEF)-like protein